MTIKCPYCNHDNEIHNDDGFGCDENEEYVLECRRCDKEFMFTVSFSPYYSVYCTEGCHEWEEIGEPAKPLLIAGKMQKYRSCARCDYSEFYEEQK